MTAPASPRVVRLSVAAVAVVTLTVGAVGFALRLGGVS